ncbi:MAG: hypothetical protein ACRDT6_02585 [Micromonosporaceae bacterium]
MITFRAAVGVAMLGGYWFGRYLVGIGLAAASVLLWRTTPGVGAALLSAVTILAVVLSARAHRLVRDAAYREPSGTVVPPRLDSPLWTEVRALCERLGVPPPDELRLGAEPAVTSWQHPRRLGLVAGPRGVYVGLPLLIGLTPAQLQALLARELAGPAGAGRLAAMCHRARATVGPMLAARPRTAGLVFAFWAQLFLAVEAPVSRQLVLTADRSAVALTGRASVAGALREVPVVVAAWQRYIAEVIAPAARAGYAPLNLSDGFDRVREAWSEELELVRTAPGIEPGHAWEVRPTRLERLHAIDLAPEAPTGSELVPLRSRSCETVRQVEREVIGADVARVPWDEFSATIASESLRGEVAQLFAAADEVAATAPGGVIEASGKAGLDTVLHLIEAGALPQLEQRLRVPARGLLAVAFAVAAVDGGVARWRTNPAGGVRVVRADGGQVPVEELAARVIVDPSTVPMVRQALRSVRAARADQLV